MTTLQALFDIEIPVIQAPMAGAQGSALAAAVSNAGGLGSLPCATLTAAAIRNEISSLQQQTSKPFNVNFFCHASPAADAAREAAWRARLSPYYRAFGLDLDTASGGPQRRPFGHAEAELLCEMRPAPAVVSFHFGLPSADLLTRIRALGSRVISSATTIEEARWLEARGVDAIIAQGLEAGGHRGMFLSDDLTTQMGIFALLPQIVRAVKTPVIAAGGIADSQGVAAAMALGAQAVQIGTAYLLCPEATTSPVHRAALKGEQAGRTALTNLFTGRPARGIVNRLMTELGAMSEVPAFPLAAAAIAPLRARAESAGSGDFSPLWAGQNACGCREVSAATLTRQLVAGIATLAPPDAAS
jgi:nitronate monooxygenase